MTDVAASDVARVRAALSSGCLLHPAEGAANTVDLAQAMASLAGAPMGTPGPKARFVMDLVGRADHYVFVLVDGLGMNLVEALPSDAFLRARLVVELRAVFPSSTAPALTSIATARWPAEHAVTGWWTYLPDAGVTATILPYIERFGQKPLDQRAVPRSYAFPVGARAPGFTHAFMMFTPKSIAGSVYSRYSAGDAPFSGFGRLRQGVEAIVERIASATGPTYSYLYVSDVDTAEHVYGPRSSQVARSLDDVQTQIAELARRLDGRGRVVVTADHGQLLVDASMTLHRDDPLVGLLSVPPTGDGRAPLFHVAEGQGDAFTRAFRERFGKDFALLQVDEAAAMGLFGPTALSAETHRRLGDFVGIATGGAALLYEPAPELATMPGHHGGLSPDEMRIPLISA